MMAQLIAIGTFVENLHRDEKPEKEELIFITSFITEAFQVIVPGVTQHPVMLPLSRQGFVAVMTCVNQFAIVFADISTFSMSE